MSAESLSLTRGGGGTIGSRKKRKHRLPGQTVKGRGCKTEEGGCFGNAEAPDDDHCNPAHVWNFSFLVYP